MSKKTTTEPKKEEDKKDSTSITPNTSEPNDQEPKKEETTSSSKGIIEASEEDGEENAEGIVNPNEETAPPKEEDTSPAHEPYELEVDENSPISDEEFQEIVAFAEEKKLSKTEAENLIKMRESSHEAAQKHFQTLNIEKIKGMEKAFKEDAEIHTAQNKKYLSDAIKSFGNDPTFLEAFKNPEVNLSVPLAKFLINVGKRISGIDTTGLTTKSTPVGKEEGKTFQGTANKLYKDM